MLKPYTKRRTYLTYHGYIFLDLRPFGVTELKVQDGHKEVDESVSTYNFTSSIVVLLGDFIPQTCWKGPREERITLQNEAISSLLKPLKRSAENVFESSPGNGKT